MKRADPASNGAGGDLIEQSVAPDCSSEAGVIPNPVAVFCANGGEGSAVPGGWRSLIDMATRCCPATKGAEGIAR